MEMEKAPEGSRAERRGWPRTEGDKKQGVRRRPSSLGGERERKSHIEVEVLHTWGLNPCEYGEIGASAYALWAAEQSARQDGPGEGSQIYKEEANACLQSSVHSICRAPVYLEVKVVISYIPGFQ